MGNLIVKDNALIEASYSLDVVEQRLILLAILEIRKSKMMVEAGKVLRIYASDYVKYFNVEKHTAYEALKRAVIGLFYVEFSYNKIDEMTGKVGYYKSRFVEDIGYIDDLGCVDLVFASKIIPFISNLEKCFTSYEIQQVSKLSSRYAIRLYEMLIKWKITGKVENISLEELRKKLGVLPSEYTRIETFKRRVLEVSLNQINEYTDILVEYNQHKQGRVITGFTFNFSFKADSQRLEQDKVPSWQLKGLSDAQIKKLKVFTQQFIDLNNDKIPTHFSGSYDELFKQWSIQLKDPKQVMQFKGISEFLERTKP